MAQPSRNILRLANVYTVQLDDATAPRACPICIQAFSAMLKDEVNIPAVKMMLSSHHAFWAACAKVASVPGATGDLSALRSRLALNAASCVQPGHAKQSLTWDPVACLMDALCSFLHLALYCGPNAKYTNIFRKGAWPCVPGDVMPNGVGPYVRWACTIPTRSGLDLVLRLTLCARLEVINTLRQFPARDRIVVTVILALCNWEMLNTSFPSRVVPFLVHDVGLGRPLSQQAGGIKYDACMLLNTIINGPDACLDDWLVISAGYEQLLYDAIVPYAMNTQNKMVQSILLCAASALQTANPHLQLPEIVSTYRAQNVLSRASPSELVSTHLWLCSTLLVYHGSGCTNRVSGIGKLQRCGACMFSLYCSRQCQRMDWKAAPVSHKKLCPSLAKVVASRAVNTSKTMAEFSSVWDEGVLFNESEKIALIEFASCNKRLGSEIKDHMALLVSMLKFLEK